MPGEKMALHEVSVQPSCGECTRRARCNGGGDGGKESVRTVANRIQWRANGASSTRIIHKAETQCGQHE